MTQPPRPGIGFFLTPPHKCGYLPDRSAVTIFVDPRQRPTVAAYSALSLHGFRRSGDHVYRPQCPGCNACIPVRIPVNEFEPRRSQLRTLRLNKDVVLIPKKPSFQREHYALYQAYLAHRHPGGSMENPDPNSYLEFLTAQWSDTTFYEFRAANRLLAVAVVDHLDDGISAVYTFFDPNEPRRSLGRLAILKEIEIARALQVRWLYLGYWISDCQKMSYKTEYSPLEYFRAGEWWRDLE
ncbi:MAG: arginyltransferase [Gammaproteobacteria bacterium]|nr:arginyltransferase [Gammaproteobacteria bacterium]